MTNWDCSQESQVKRKGKRASMADGRGMMLPFVILRESV